MLQACAPNLSDRLGEPVPSNRILGTASGYLQQRYGFPSLSNPCLHRRQSGSFSRKCLSCGNVAVSLGTSDTLLFWCEKANPKPSGHVFVNPIEDMEVI